MNEPEYPGTRCSGNVRGEAPRAHRKFAANRSRSPGMIYVIPKLFVRVVAALRRRSCARWLRLVGLARSRGNSISVIHDAPRRRFVRTRRSKEESGPTDSRRPFASHFARGFACNAECHSRRVRRDPVRESAAGVGAGANVTRLTSRRLITRRYGCRWRDRRIVRSARTLTLA